MSHAEQMDFMKSMKEKFPLHFTNAKILEVGSLNINGSFRDIVEDSRQYIGLDVGKGPGVDIVVPGQDYDGPSNYFDIVVSAECFEHNPYWLETFFNMIRMCRPGGLVLMSCATKDRPEHGTSRTSPRDSPLTLQKGWDYYRNLEETDFLAHFNPLLHFSEHNFSVNNNGNVWANDLYFYGLKHDTNFGIRSN